MFRDRIFSIAFLVSISWHLICMFLFTIVILPISLPMSTISNVSFLGPLLEKTAFELMLDKNSQPKQATYQEPMFFNNAFLMHEEGRPGKTKFNGFSLKGQADPAEVSANDLFGGYKIIPEFSTKASINEQKAPPPPAAKRDDAFLIEGPLARREIILMPEAPVAAKRVGVEQKNFFVELKVKVAGDGKVERADLLASSGYPDIDLAAINYIKGFQFSAADINGQAVWDKVKLSIKSQ